MLLKVNVHKKKTRRLTLEAQKYKLVFNLFTSFLFLYWPEEIIFLYKSIDTWVQLQPPLQLAQD